MRWGAVVFVFLVALAAPAHAENAWEAGVSVEDQGRAKAIADEAATLVTQSPAAALEKYQAAIQIWDSPVFRFRMAITLMQLGRDAEAGDAIEASLRFGKAPFTDDEYQQALSYRAMLEEKLKAGQPAPDVTYERRFGTWIPWTVMGGAALGLVLGTGVELIANGDMDDYDQRVASSCAVNGCNFTNPQTPQEKALVSELNAQRDKAEREHLVGHVMLGLGVAALATGIVLFVVNRPHAVHVDAHVSASGASASLRWAF